MNANTLLQKITEHTYYLPGANNLGIITTGDGGVIAIDTGMKNTARTLRKALDEAGLTLRAIINTHHHADHTGGNAYLLRTYPDAQIYAPPMEAVIIEHPILEPTFLSFGASPISALRSRWLMAESTPVHHILGNWAHIEKGTTHSARVGGVALDVVPLPGHTMAQVGIAFEGVCFAADGFFGPAVVAKHGVPYAHDIAAQLASLDRLETRDDQWFLPGHGDLTSRIAIREVLAINRAAIQRTSSLVFQALPGDLADITGRVIYALHQRQEEQSTNKMNIPQYAVFSGAIASHLSYLEHRGEADVVLHNHRLIWQPSSSGSEQPV